MKFVKQKTTLNIDNHDLNKNTLSKHGALFPISIRCIIVGPSSCGKTNVMLSLIEHPNGLKFENIYLYSKSLHQPKYTYLEQLLKPIKGIGFYAFKTSENITNVSKAKPNSLFIFDDVACDKQDVMRECFSMGRHYQLDAFYLCQSYVKLEKRLLRDNCNMLVIFKQDNINLKHIYDEHIGSDMTFMKFQLLCANCWKQPYGFLSIFKDSKINEGRYRQGFDTFIEP